VRDAAAYVCWAFARAYSAETVLPMVNTLAPALLTAACYDREVRSHAVAGVGLGFRLRFLCPADRHPTCHNVENKSTCVDEDL